MPHPATVSADHVLVRPLAASATGTLWLFGALLFGLALVYFIGIDQGAVSVTGPGALLHEVFHDARHSLGFPCH